jgi:hypothetical protein
MSRKGRTARSRTKPSLPIKQNTSFQISPDLKRRTKGQDKGRRWRRNKMEMEEANLVIQSVGWTTTSNLARYHVLVIVFLSVFLPVFISLLPESAPSAHTDNLFLLIPESAPSAHTEKSVPPTPTA